METDWIIQVIRYGFGFIGLVFLCIAFGLIITGKKKRTVCTQMVPAVIVDVERMDSTSTDGTSMVSWFPVYEYWYGGNRIRKRARIGSARQDFYVGQRVELYLNPQNPNEFYCPVEKNKLVEAVFLGVGCLLLIIAVLLTIGIPLLM